MAYTLKPNQHDVLTLKDLRTFINNTCIDLSNDTKIEIYNPDKQQTISKGITIIADESSIEFYPE